MANHNDTARLVDVLTLWSKIARRKGFCPSVALAALLLIGAFAGIHALKGTSVQATGTSPNQDVLLQFEWPQFMGSSSFTRFSSGPAPSSPEILWKAKVPGIQSYISAFDGMIFVTTSDSVVALDRTTGGIIWETKVPLTSTWPVAYKIDNEHMIVEGSCLNPKTGKILWTSPNFSADTGIFNANVFSPEEKMFYTKVDSYIKAWSFADPSKPPPLIWTTYVPGGGKTGIGTTYGDGKVFVGSFKNQQLALDAKTGEVLWTTLTKGPMIFSGAYSDGRFFRGGTDDNTLYCFNATDGNVLWTYTPDTDGYFTTRCAVAYGMVYELNKDGCLYTFDVETGDLVWKYQGPGTMLWPGHPTVADGKIYATTGQAAQYGGEIGISEFSCLDAYSGRVLWKLPIEALAPRESVAVAYGNLYLIPGNVTTAVDAISGGEYTTLDEVWAIGTKTIPVSSWPMWRADSAHSSSAHEGPSNLTIAWKFATKGSVISSPSIVDGVVYVGSQDKNIYALGAWSGQLIWNFSTQNSIESSPAVAYGRVYTGGDDGYVYCLDASTGTFIWRTFVNGDLPYTYGSLVLKSSPAIYGGKVYIGSLDGCLYSLNADNGHVEWKFETEGPILSSPAVESGFVYFYSEEPTAGALYSLDAETGSMIWKQFLPYEYQFTGGNEMMGSPSVAGGMVFASSNLRTYFGINATTGDFVWNFTDPDAMEFIVSSPIYVNGELFLIDKFSIACLNATNGITIWSYFTGDELYVSPSYADGKIYVVTSQRHLFILDAARNGSKIASATTPSSSWSSPTISNGRLYVGNHDWNVYCFTDFIDNEVAAPPDIKQDDSVYLYILIAAILAALALLIGYIIKRSSKK